VGDYVKMSDIVKGSDFYTTDFFIIEGIVYREYNNGRYTISYELDRCYYADNNHLTESCIEFDSKTSRNMKLKSLGIE